MTLDKDELLKIANAFSGPLEIEADLYYARTIEDVRFERIRNRLYQAAMLRSAYRQEELLEKILKRLENPPVSRIEPPIPRIEKFRLDP